MERFKKKYEIRKLTRQRGRWRYIWNWIVYCGIPMFVIQTFFISGSPLPGSRFYSETTRYPISWLIFMLVLAVLLSVLMGALLWSFNEHKFKKMLKDEAAINKILVSDNLNPSQKANTQAPEMDNDLSKNILRKIKYAWIACIVCGIVTLGIAPFEAIFIFGMAFGIYKKSRLCAILMFVYVISKIILLQAVLKNGIVLAVISFWIFLQGVIGTFAYHKHIKK